jgi:hypothetical protein
VNAAATTRPRRAVAVTRAADNGVVALVLLRITRALARRTRYKYVQPRVVALDDGARAGWQVLSPNCSRTIDASGGEIAIAWLLQQDDGRWRLHARDHAAGAWRQTAADLSLDAALARVCSDPLGEYWP